MAKIGKFLDGLCGRLEKDSSALNFFKCFLRNNLVEEINKHTQSGLADMETVITDKRAWEIIYQVAAELLWDAAVRNHSEVHPDIFDEANNVSEAFCAEIRECLGFDVEPIRIRSIVDEMAKEGLVKVEDDYVKLTQKGEQFAKEIRQELSE